MIAQERLDRLDRNAADAVGIENPLGGFRPGQPASRTVFPGHCVGRFHLELGPHGQQNGRADVNEVHRVKIKETQQVHDRRPFFRSPPFLHILGGAGCNYKINSSL